MPNVIPPLTLISTERPRSGQLSESDPPAGSIPIKRELYRPDLNIHNTDSLASSQHVDALPNIREVPFEAAMASSLPTHACGPSAAANSTPPFQDYSAFSSASAKLFQSMYRSGRSLSQDFMQSGDFTTMDHSNSPQDPTIYDSNQFSLPAGWYAGSPQPVTNFDAAYDSYDPAFSMPSYQMEVDIWMRKNSPSSYFGPPHPHDFQFSELYPPVYPPLFDSRHMPAYRMAPRYPTTTPAKGNRYNGRNIKHCKPETKKHPEPIPPNAIGVFPTVPGSSTPTGIELLEYHVKFLLNKNLIPEIFEHHEEISALCSNIGAKLAVGGVRCSPNGSNNADRWCLLTSDCLETLSNVVMMISHLLRNRLRKKGNDQANLNKKKQANFQRSTFKFLFDSKVDGEDGLIRKDLQAILEEVETIRPTEGTKTRPNQSVFPTTRDSLMQLYKITSNFSLITFNEGAEDSRVDTLTYLRKNGLKANDIHLRVFFGDRWDERDENQECLFGIISEVKATPDTCLNIIRLVAQSLAKRNKEAGLQKAGDTVTFFDGTPSKPSFDVGANE